MRVLYLNPFSQQVSGPDESLLTLLVPLVKLGIDPHVVLPRPGPASCRYEAVGATMHYAPLTILKRRVGASALALPVRAALGAAAVMGIARRVRPDLIHTNMEVVPDGALVSRALRLPHVLHYRGNTNDEPQLLFDVLTRFWTSTAERVLCISHATADIFLRRGLGAKVEVVYNPVDTDAFASAGRSDEVRRALGAGPDETLIVTIGRIHPRKDIATFLRAAALISEGIPRAKFAIVGAAEATEERAYEIETRALAEQLDVRVTWAGVRRDIPVVLKSCELFMLCSRHEGFGRVVAEAITTGTPLVVPGEGAPAELVRTVPFARVAPPGEPHRFAMAAFDLLRGGSLRGAGLTTFDAAATARSVLDVYRTVERSPKNRSCNRKLTACSPERAPNAYHEVIARGGPPPRPEEKRFSVKNAGHDLLHGSGKPDGERSN
jgi:glycosyltransferase involved in cell wall biosynthesis